MYLIKRIIEKDYKIIQTFLNSFKCSSSYLDIIKFALRTHWSNKNTLKALSIPLEVLKPGYINELVEEEETTLLTDEYIEELYNSLKILSYQKVNTSEFKVLYQGTPMITNVTITEEGSFINVNIDFITPIPFIDSKGIHSVNKCIHNQRFFYTHPNPTIQDIGWLELDNDFYDNNTFTVHVEPNDSNSSNASVLPTIIALTSINKNTHSFYAMGQGDNSITLFYKKFKNVRENSKNI